MEKKGAHSAARAAKRSRERDRTTGLRVVLEAGKSHDAHFVLLVGDVFDNNRQPAHILDRSAELLANAGRPVLILPGYADSGPDHWQSHWERADPRCRRVVQRDWLEPRLDHWLVALEREIGACATPPVLAAHSLGCLLAVPWAAGRRPRHRKDQP